MIPPRCAVRRTAGEEGSSGVGLAVLVAAHHSSPRCLRRSECWPGDAPDGQREEWAVVTRRSALGGPTPLNLHSRGGGA